MVALDLLTHSPLLVCIILVAGERKTNLQGEPAIGDLTLEVQTKDLRTRGDLLPVVVDAIVVACVVRDAILGLILIVCKDIKQTRVEALDKEVDLCPTEGEVHIIAEAEGVRDLRAEVISIGHALSFTTDDTDVQVFVKDLRGTEALGIGCTDVEVLRGIVAQGSSWAEDGLLYSRVLIEARTE